MALQQVVLDRAVKHHLPSAFASLLERVDEFEIGKVLLHYKKPRFWRHKELDFTGFPLHSLLADSKNFKFETQTTVEFTSDSDKSQRVVNVDLDVDAEVKTHWLDIGGSIGGGEKKTLNLSIDFGKVDHITSDMFQVLSSKKWSVDLNHTLVKDAMDRGMEMFIIISVYQASKVDIKVSDQVSADIENKESIHINVAPVKVGDKEDAKENTARGYATSRDVPTNIAFHVMKVTLNKHGQLGPVLESGFDHHYKIHLTYADAFSVKEDTGTQDAKSADASKPQETASEK